jgi:hypothetical protein
VSSKVNLLQAVQFVADSWREIGSKTTQNCLCHCDLKHSGLEIPETAKSEYEAISEVQNGRNYEEFQDIDNNVECYNENEDCEDEIVESILSRHQDEELEGEESDKDDTSELERGTIQDARKFIDRLRRYFMQEGNGVSPLSALDVCADFVHSLWSSDYPSLYKCPDKNIGGYVRERTEIYHSPTLTPVYSKEFLSSQRHTKKTEMAGFCQRKVN